MSRQRQFSGVPTSKACGRSCIEFLLETDRRPGDVGRAPAYARFFGDSGFGEEAEGVNAAWKAGDRTGAVKAISARVLDGLGAVGSADFCHERLGAFARTGATPVVLPFAPPGPGARASLLRTFRAFP